MKTFNVLTLSAVIVSSTLFMACQKKSNNNPEAEAPPAPATSSTPIYTTQNAILQCPAEFRNPVGGMQQQPYVNGVPAQAQIQNDLTYSFEENVNGQICRTGVQQGFSQQDLCQKLVNNSMNFNCAKEQRAQMYLQRCAPCTVVSGGTLQNQGPLAPGQYPQIPAPGSAQPPVASHPGQVSVPARDPQIVDVRCAISSVDLSGRRGGRTFNKVINLEWNQTAAQTFELPVVYTSVVGVVKLNLTPSSQNNGNMSLQVGADRAVSTDLDSRVRVEVQDLGQEISVIADCMLGDYSKGQFGFARRKAKSYSCQMTSANNTINVEVKKSKRSVELASSVDGQISATKSSSSAREFLLEEKKKNGLTFRYAVPYHSRLSLGFGQVNQLGQGAFSALCSPL
jgi:hypothetical protein